MQNTTGLRQGFSWNSEKTTRRHNLVQFYYINISGIKMQARKLSTGISFILQELKHEFSSAFVRFSIKIRETDRS